MRIDVERLREAGEPFAHTYAPEELALGDESVRLTSEVKVAGRVSRKGEQVRLRGDVSTAVEARCDRCLRPVTLPVEVGFDARYVPAEGDGAEAGEEAAELKEDDLSFSVYEGDAVDVDELVREQVLLALPTRLLCRDECKGLCPVCGADLNRETCACEQKEVDPRWAALAALKQERE
jgi:uncharacterized protein